MDTSFWFECLWFTFFSVEWDILNKTTGLGALFSKPFPLGQTCPCHVCWESCPWGWNHQRFCSAWTQTWPSPWLPAASWPRGAQRCKGCYGHRQGQTQRLSARGPHWIQGWQLPATHCCSWWRSGQGCWATGLLLLQRPGLMSELMWGWRRVLKEWIPALCQHKGYGNSRLCLLF